VLAFRLDSGPDVFDELKVHRISLPALVGLDTHSYEITAFMQGILTIDLTTEQDSSMALVKGAMRQRTKTLLGALSTSDIEARSAALTEQLLRLPCIEQAHAVSCFLSMPSGEVRTDLLLRRMLHATLSARSTSTIPNKKRLFVPKITGKAPQDMLMLEVGSLACLDAYPKNKWGIPEPVHQAPDATTGGVIDVVLVPGVVFDQTCGRMGHGKGYYDSFLSRLTAAHTGIGRARCIAVGLCFDEQVLEAGQAVPVEAHDVPLDFVVTPTRVLSRPN